MQKCDTEFYGQGTQSGAIPTPHWGWLACNWFSIRRISSYYNVNMKPSNYFPGSALRKKMEIKSIYCYFPSARQPCRQWDIFSAHFHLSSLYWLQSSSVSFHQQRCDFLLAWTLYRQSIIQSVADRVFYGQHQLQCIHIYALSRNALFMFKAAKYIFMNRDLRHYYGNLILSVRSKLIMVFSSRKCKIPFLMSVHWGIMFHCESSARLL